MMQNDRVKVTIDLRKVASNLRTSEGAVTEATARSFIQSTGFDPDSDGNWIGSRASLHRFNPGEVVGVESASSW
jgi:hypothetical protein